MKPQHSAPLFGALFLLLGACGSTPEGAPYAPVGPPVALDEPPPAPEGPAPVQDIAAPVATEASPAAEATAPPAVGELTLDELEAEERIARAAQPAEAAFAAPKVQPAATYRDPLELSLWDDPRFHRWILESYASEVDVEPGLTVIEREQLEKILELMSEDQMDKALAQLEKSRGDAASALFDFMVANIHFQREEFEQASEALEVAVAKYPRFRRAWQNLGVIRFRAADYERAIPALTKVIELGGSNAVTYGMLGFGYTNVGNFLSAETAYRMAVLMDPATSDWKQGLSFCLFKQGRFAETVALCDALLAEDPDRADLWMTQANAWLGLEKPMKAAENFELVDRLGESTAASLDKLGDIYVSEELFDLALDAYERALRKDPAGGVARAIRAARILASRGALEETGELILELGQLEEGAIDDAQRTELLRLEAQVALARGAGDEQARVLEELVALDPLDGQALILLAQHHEAKGELEQATFYYERAMNLPTHEADANLGMAQLLVRQGKYKEALPHLRRALSLDPRENVAEFLEQIEKYASAR